MICKSSVALTIALVAIAAIAYVLRAPEQPPRHVSTHLDPAFFDAAYRAAPRYSRAPAGTAGGTIPHHLLAAPLLAGYFESLKSVRPLRIVIIGPDHLGRSSQPVVTTTGAWRTPYGILKPDLATVESLIGRGLAVEDQQLFDVEHSIAAIVPFIRRSLPRATIVPILVNPRLRSDKIQAIAAALPRDDRTLVLASVDFSHYLPDRVARFHDRFARSVLTNFDTTKMRKLEVDSVESLGLLLEVLTMRGAQSAELVAADTGAALSKNLDEPETTSYVLMRFKSGPPTHNAVLTELRYPYDDELDSRENRFFRGMDGRVRPEAADGPPRLEVLDGEPVLHLPPTNPGVAAGVVRENNDITTIYLFPIRGPKGSRRLLTGAEASQVLDAFAADSPVSEQLRQSIRSGIIEL